MNIDDKFQLIENKVQNSLDIFEQKIHDYTNKLNDIIELSKKCYLNGYSLLDIIYLLEETSYLDKIVSYHKK